VDALAPGGEPIAYDSARKVFAPGSDRHWAAYCAGPLLVLMRDRNLQLRGGVRIVIDSRVPEGKGVSSSAAIETASMAALATAFGVTLSDEDLALLCQKAEQLVAGAPCGVMDQMACVFGEPDALMALLCQPAQRLPLVPIPDDIAFWGLDSGERHFVGGSDYTAVRTAAFMGLRIISVHRGLQSAAPTSQSTDYLANITPREFEREFAQHLPVGISGADFLSRYHGTSDNATRVDPARTYHVRPATAHPVYEHDRVTRFRELLLAPPSEQRRREAGGLLYESHASYSACGLGSPGTDRLVELVRSDGAAAGLYGARITGGGSGGTVVVMGRPDAGPSIARVADAYAAQTGHRPYVFSGSSAGVASCGVFDLTI
jgi:galactokinase